MPGALTWDPTPAGGGLSTARGAQNPTADNSVVSGAGNAEVADWAALVAVSSPTVGRNYTVLAPLCTGGASGTSWQWSGSFWRPAGGQILAYMPTQIDGINGGSTAEQILWSPLFPSGMFRGVRQMRILGRFIASATETNNRTVRVRFGTTGTASDQLVSGGVGNMASANRQCSIAALLAVTSDTALRSWGQLSGLTAVTPFTTGGTNTADIADASVPSLAANAQYVSLSVQQGASPTATLSLSIASIYVE